MALIDFFNPTAPQSDSFNYGTEAEKVKRKRALAEYLQRESFKQDKTQVVPGGPNGFAVSNGRWSPLVKMLQAYMSKKTGEDADADQVALDGRSRDELASALSDEPWKQRARDAQVAREADAEMLRESRRGSGVEAGEAVVSQPEGAQAFPVQDRGPIEVRELPPSPPLAKALSAPTDPAARIGTEVGRASNTNPIVPNMAPEQALKQARADLLSDPSAAGLSAGEFGLRVQKRQQEILGGMLQGQQPQPAKAAVPPPAAPLPSQGPAPTAMPNAMAAPQPVPQVQAATPQVQQPQPAATGPIGDPRAMTEQAAATAQPTKADLIKQIVRISNSGPLGQQVAQGMFAQTFGPKANGLEFKTVKQGDNEVLVAVDPRTGESKVVWSAGKGEKSVAERRLEHDITKDEREAGVKATEKARGQANAIQSNEYAVRKIDELLPKVGDATGMGGKVSNWFNKTTGIPTDSAVATEELESIKGTLMATAMAMTKEQAGSAAGLSQVESEALTKSIASLDPRIGEKALVQQLGEVRRQLLMYGSRLGGSSPQAESPTGLDWKK